MYFDGLNVSEKEISDYIEVLKNALQWDDVYTLNLRMVDIANTMRYQNLSFKDACNYCSDTFLGFTTFKNKVPKQVQLINAEKFEFWLDEQIAKNEESLIARLHPKTRSKITGIVNGLKLTKENLNQFYIFENGEIKK